MAAVEIVPRARVRLRFPGVRWRDVAGTIVIMDLDNSAFYAVEGSIATIWPRIVEGVVIDELVDELALEYDAPPDEIMADICELVAQLVARGAVDIEG
jgi:hypothetical protein